MTARDEEFEDIVIEFEGNFDLESLKDKQLQMIGLNSDEPVLRIDSKYYKLDMKDSIGSRLILKHKEDGKLEYFAKTDKVITARRAVLKSKQS